MMKIKDYRVTCIIAESLLILSPADYEIVPIIVHAYNEDQAISVGMDVIKKEFPGKIVLSADIEPMFN